MLGEPDAPPWPPPLVPEPVCASAKPPPQAKATAAARVIILEVCLTYFSLIAMCRCHADRHGAEGAWKEVGKRCAATAGRRERWAS